MIGSTNISSWTKAFQGTGKAVGLWAGVLFLIVLCASPSPGQVNVGTIDGIVYDTQGAAIPNARVELQNFATGLTRTAAPDGSGHYSLQLVPIGDYHLTVTADGFEASQVERIHVNASDSLNIPVTMRVAGASQQVTVTAGAEGIETESSEQTATIDSAQLNTLPTVRQDWTNLVQLEPSIQKTTNTTTTVGSVNGSSGININGLPSAGYIVTVDGTNATSNPEYMTYNEYQGPNVINTVGNDAIAEISVVKGVAPATVGYTLSGNLNIITRGGSNTFHGGVYEINETAYYDARNQFVGKRTGITYNQFGGNIGGPIVRDKVFFFTNYEGARAYSQAIVSGNVPTPYLKSIAPAVYQGILATWPSAPQPASATALTTSYSGGATQQQKDGSGLVRLDWNPTERNQFAIRYIRARPNYLIPSLIPSNPQTYYGHEDSFNFSLIHVNGEMTASTRFGFNTLKLTRVNPAYSTETPTFNYAGLNNGQHKSFDQNGNYLTVEQNFGVQRGRHSIQLGGIFQPQYCSRFFVQTPTISYATAASFQSNSPTGVILALYQLPSDTPNFGLRNYYFGGFIQDDWRITNQLTLNLGFRYDYQTVARENNGRLYNRGVDPSSPQLGFGFGPYRPADSFINADYSGYQPRVGLAWVPYSHTRYETAVHVGFGIMKQPQNFYEAAIGELEPGANLPFTQSLTAPQIAGLALQYPIDPTLYEQQLKSLQSLGLLSSQLASIAANAHDPNPYGMVRTLGVQQAMPLRSTLTVDYVGSVGVFLKEYRQFNLPDRVTGISPVPTFSIFNATSSGDHSNYNALQTKLTSSGYAGFYLSAAYTWGKVLCYGACDVLQGLYPQNQGDTDKKAEYGRGLFDLRNRFTLAATYTPALERLPFASHGLGRQVLGGWQIAGIFRGQTGFPATVTNSGSTYPSDRPDVNPGVAPYLSGYRSFSRNHQYLSPTAYTKVAISPLSKAQIHGGTLRRAAQSSPGSEYLDASLQKAFAITEGSRLTLKLNAYNVLNHTNLSGLNTDINSSSFGRLTSATARNVQLEGRFTF